MSSYQAAIPITDPSQIGEARRQAVRMAEEVSFGETDRGKAALIASELATNQSRYASGGEILLQSGASADRKWIDVLAIDRGPGLRDVGKCLEDGYSTGGTAGTGLGATRRMANEFDLFASPAGTVVFCRVIETTANSPGRSFLWGAVNRPAQFETECGDAWRIGEHNGGLAIMVVDGLGHGPEAAKAAQEAVAVFDRDPFTPLPRFFESAHARMQATRGAAMAAAQIDAQSGAMKYVGVGNIAGHLRSGDQSRRGLFSNNGIVGGQFIKIREFDYECPAGSLLIMHSDGLRSRWSLENYAGLSRCHPAVIAGILYRDFTRGRDDVTVAVVRLSTGESDH